MAEGRIDQRGNLCCPGCGRKGAEVSDAGVEIRCSECKLDYSVDLRLWVVRTDYLLAEKLGKLVDVFSDFISRREQRLVSIAQTG